MEGKAMDAVSYKKFHESFMQNNNGSSIVEVFGVIVAPYFTIFHCINLVLVANIISIPLRFLLEFILIVLLIVTNVTVANEYIPGIVLTLLVGSVAAAAGQLRSVLHEAPFIQLPTARPEFISMARALINLLSVVCILAVDFQCFPRRFAKTETYGVSLMDVGVGLYVFANGIVSRDGRHSEEPLSWRKIKKLAISISPLIVLGFGRSISISATNYHEHVSEYGVHWNFFVTLAFTAFFGALLVAPLNERDHLKFVAIVIITIHEMCLQLGLGSYVLSDSRENIFEANKEGIFSLPGYLAIYIASMYIQNSLRWSDPMIKCREFLLQTAKMGLIALCLWKMVYIAEEMFGISRRLANMGYVIWILAIGTTMVTLLMMLELAYYFLKFDKTKSDECVHQYGPIILNAINYNGLLFFLTANLLTGAINLTVQTMLLDTVTSVAIVTGYMLILCSLQTVLYVYKICAQLHKNLHYFETLHVSDLSHRIVKRGTKPSSHPFNTIKEVEFKALGRNFRLILHPHKEVLHSNFRAYAIDGDGQEKIVHMDHDAFYSGRVFGEADSSVRAHIEDNGVMTASVVLPDETYHIEPSWRHLPHKDSHMIAYKASDVKLSWSEAKNPGDMGAPITCGYVKEDPEMEEQENAESMWMEEGHRTREKRQADQYEYTPTKTRCPLLLVADYRFFQEMGGSNTKTTINYLISLIDRVHKIYNDTVWQDRSDQEGFKGMGFVIKKIVVHSEPTRVRGGEAHYNMVREKWDVRNLLEVFSREYSHKDFCLAHLFTDLKFEGGILGLAYVGSPRRNSVGGICTPEYFKNGYTLYLNSGLSSSRNHYGQRVITREADLVTAHEFGHNWGSEHDPDIPECSPSASQGGSFLMYTYSVSGYDVNNKKFSPCSLRSIRKVLQAKSGRCFSEPEESFCGNLRVEGDEQCDAGLLGTEDNDGCCDKNCKLRRNQGAVCSDKNSPCCQNCQYMPVGVKCREAQYSTCEQEARCTGNHAECPKSPPMADGTICQERGQCRGGKCVPYCETQGLQSCMCDIIQDACKRCCRMSINETCFPVEPPDVLPDGTPCIQGFCNKGICEKTIQDVVERFWDIIEEININKVLRFLRDNIVMTVVLLTALFWIPASCVISYFDRKKRKQEFKTFEWSQTLDLIHPSDRRRVIHIRVPRQKITVARM